MIHAARRSLPPMAPVASLALVLVFAVSAARVIAAPQEETIPKPSVAMPKPIPIEALDRMPQDATAYCGDGTWSNAGTKAEACSSRGGIAVWFGPAPSGTTGRCKDGTYTRAKKGTLGSCSGSGGIRMWFSQPTPAVPRPN